MLYELAHGESDSTATDVGRKLGLDAGYLSRLLRSLEQRRLVQRRPSPEDGRRSNLTLTRKGRSAFARLDASAHATQVAEWLDAPLRKRISGAASRAMETIERVLASAEPAQREVVLREPLPGDMGWVIERHGELYAAEYGWSAHFEALVAQIVAQFMHEHDPARERCWIASHRRRSASGSIFLVSAIGHRCAAAPSARGAGRPRNGRGTKTRRHLSAIRARCGLPQGHALDQRRARAQRARSTSSKGFRLVHEEPHTHFGSEQLGQDWELELSS